MIKLLFSLFFVLLTLLPGGGTAWGQERAALRETGVQMDLPSRRIEDDSSLRISLEAPWFTETPDRVSARRSEIHTLRGGSRIQVRVETSPRNRDEFAIVLARERNGEFLSYNQGSWSLIRRWDNDPSGLRIQVFLRSD